MYIFIVIILFLNLKDANGQFGCNVPLKLYSELNCKPIYDNPNSNCPLKYDCSNLARRDPGKCYLLGISFNNGEHVPSYVSKPYCKMGCTCQNSQFQCAITDCPRANALAEESPCVRKRELNECCQKQQICRPLQENLCQVDGIFYNENELFYPESNKNFKCVCQQGFNGTLALPFCMPHYCLSELYDLPSIRKMCAPIYSITKSNPNPKCPSKFLCSIPHDVQFRYGYSNRNDYCKIGPQRLRINDEFTKEEFVNIFTKDVLHCKCIIPPFVTCTKSTVIDKDKMPPHLRNLNLPY